MMTELIDTIRESVKKFRIKELEKNCKYWEFEQRKLPEDYVKQIDEKLGIINLQNLGEGEKSNLAGVQSVIITELAKSCASLAFVFAQHYSVISTGIPFENDSLISVFIPYSVEGEVFYIKKKKKLTGYIDYMVGKEFSNQFVVPAFDENENHYILLASGELSATETVDFMPGLNVLDFGKVNFTDSEITDIFIFSNSKEYEKTIDLLYGNMLQNMLSLYYGQLLRAYEIVSNYVNERKQGGVLIINHPPVKNIIKNIDYIIFETAAAIDYLIYHPEESRKIYFPIAEKVEDALLDSIQCLGGYGYMEDYGLERLLRDFRSIKSLFTESPG